MADAKLIINLNLIGIDEAALLSSVEDDIKQGMEKLAEDVEWAWRKKAAEVLHTSRQEYLDGLRVDHNDGDIQVSLSGWLPVALETGFPSFDMHSTLLADGSASKVIPIRTPDGVPIFRTISVGSPGWIHPGFDKRGIGEDIQEDLPGMIDEAFKNVFPKVTV